MTRVQQEIEIISAFLTTRALARAQEADDFAARLADAQAAAARAKAGDAEDQREGD